METCMTATGSMVNTREKDFLDFLMEKVDLMKHITANGRMTKCTDTEFAHISLETFMKAIGPIIK